MKKLHMTWRYNDVKGFGDNDEAGVAKFYYGTNLVESPVATEFVELEMPDLPSAEKLYAFIKGVSTHQWEEGWGAAIREVQALWEDC